MAGPDPRQGAYMYVISVVDGVRNGIDRRPVAPPASHSLLHVLSSYICVKKNLQKITCACMHAGMSVREENSAVHALVGQEAPCMHMQMDHGCGSGPVHGRGVSPGTRERGEDSGL